MAEAAPDRADLESRLRRAATLCEEALRQYYHAERVLLRLGTVAIALDTPPETVRAWIRSGLLTPVRIGRAVYVARSDLEKFVEHHRGQGVPKVSLPRRGRRGRFEEADS